VRTICREAVESAGDDGGEGRDDEQEGQVRENDEQLLGTRPDVVRNDGADRLPPVPNRRKKGPEIMHGPEEYTPEEYPQQNRKPAENSGLNGAVNRACARDGRKVVPQKDGGFCRNIVLSVVNFVGRGFPLWVYPPLLCQPGPVCNVAYDQHNN